MNTINLKPISNTVLKAKLADSSTLNKNDTQSIDAGTLCKCDWYVPILNKNHAKIRLNEKEWFIYLPHWNLIDIFPSGVPKPFIKHDPITNDVIEAIVNYCLRVGIKKYTHIAYILSTAENESNFKPIREIRGKVLTSDQKKYWSSGYMGRGFIQVTWKKNYQTVGDKLGLNLIGNPNLLLTYPVAIASLVLGMKEGWYTHKKLSDYKEDNYWSMRNIVNPGEIKYKMYHYKVARFVRSAKNWEAYLSSFAAMYDGIEMV